MVKVGFKLFSEDPAEAPIEVGAGNKTAPDWFTVHGSALITEQDWN